MTLVLLWHRCFLDFGTPFLMSESHLPRNFFYVLQWKPFKKLFKNDEKCFLFHVKSSFCLWDICIFILTFWLYRKRLTKKAMVNFKIYDVTDWTSNNYNKHIAQYLKKERQPQHEKYNMRYAYSMKNILLKK